MTRWRIYRSSWNSVESMPASVGTSDARCRRSTGRRCRRTSSCAAAEVTCSGAVMGESEGKWLWGGCEGGAEVVVFRYYLFSCPRLSLSLTFSGSLIMMLSSVPVPVSGSLIVMLSSVPIPLSVSLIMMLLRRSSLKVLAHMKSRALHPVPHPTRDQSFHSTVFL